MIYTKNNVFEEALNRIRMIYDTHDEVLVSMSGGKDSTVVLHLALIVAKEKGRLPVKVYWLDQEVEWQHTVDYMDSIFRRPDVEPYWFQFPFDFTNSLSPQTNFIRVFDESCPEKWIHQRSDIGITENPTGKNRFHDIVSYLGPSITQKKCAVLVGLRIIESPARRLAITGGNAKWNGITWCTHGTENARTFWPIYDFTNDDIWTAIAKNHWDYNKVYDMMYQWGVPKTRMRVSALIHEMAYGSIQMLQEFEPETYNKFVARVPGTHTFNHAYDESGIVPKDLPFAFKDWKEYRDYLLVHITKPEYWELFRKRWNGQDGEYWYRVHVCEVIINDIDGTANENAKIMETRSKLMGEDGKLTNRYKKQFEDYMRRKENDKGPADSECGMDSVGEDPFQ